MIVWDLRTSLTVILGLARSNILLHLSVSVRTRSYCDSLGPLTKIETMYPWTQHNYQVVGKSSSQTKVSCQAEHSITDVLRKIRI